MLGIWDLYEGYTNSSFKNVVPCVELFYLFILFSAFYILLVNPGRITASVLRFEF